MLCLQSRISCQEVNSFIFTIMNSNNPQLALCCVFLATAAEWRQGGAGHVMNSVCTNQDQYAGMASWWMLLPIKLQCSLVCTQHTVLVCLEVLSRQSCLLLSLFFISTHPSFLTTCLSTTIWYYQNTFCVLFIYIYIYYLINLLCYIHYFHLTEHNLHLSIIIVLVELCHWWIWGTLLNLHVVFQVKSY